MVHASYRHNSSVYDVIMIEDDSCVSIDMEKVLDVISDTNLVIYEEYMRLSIVQGLAYAVWKDGEKVGFVYNRMDGNKYRGVSIKVTGVVAVLLAMKTMFELCDTHKISFVPHTSNIREFLSMVYGPDIRAYYSGANDVVIRRDAMIKKGLRMYKYLGIEKVL